jgi:hypothetical protein
MSTSIMAALPEAERKKAIAEIEALAAAQPDPMRFSYTTEIYLCWRR